MVFLRAGVLLVEGDGRGGEPWCMGSNVETEREEVRHQGPPTRLRPLVALRLV